MCFPVAVAGFSMTAAQTAAVASVVTTVASTALSIRGQQAQADAQRRAQEAAMERENQRMIQDLTAQRVKQGMENEVLTQKLIANTKVAQAKRATAKTSAIENNKSGVNVDAMLADYTRQEGENNLTLVRQAQFGDISRSFAFENAYAQTALNKAKLNQPIAQPNILAEGLGAVSSLTGIYGNYQQNRYNELRIQQMG